MSFDLDSSSVSGECGYHFQLIAGMLLMVYLTIFLMVTYLVIQDLYALLMDVNNAGVSGINFLPGSYPGPATRYRRRAKKGGFHRVCVFEGDPLLLASVPCPALRGFKQLDTVFNSIQSLRHQTQTFWAMTKATQFGEMRSTMRVFIAPCQVT